MKATDSEQFKVLLETLEKYNQRYVSAALSVTGALLVVIGWLLTAVPVREFFGCSVYATVTGIIVTIPLIYIYAFSMLRVYRVNRDVYDKLKALDYMDESLYSQHAIPREYLWFGIGLNVWHYVVIAGLVANHRWHYL